MRKYDSQFKQNAVKKILEGQSMAAVSRELGVGENLLHKWKQVRISSTSNAEREVVELRKKLREAEMESDILKKAALSSGAKLFGKAFAPVASKNVSSLTAAVTVQEESRRV